MSDATRRALAPGWRVEVGDFHHWEPQARDLPFDLLTAAQAWRWVDRELATKQAERLLRKGVWLACHLRPPSKSTDTPLRRETDAIYDEQEDAAGCAA